MTSDTRAPREPIEAETSVFWHGASCRIAQWRALFVAHWFGPVRVDDLEACQRGSFDLAARNPRGITVLNIIEHGLRLPAPAERAKAAEVVGSTADHVNHAATVILGQGFWNSAGRAIVAGITLFSKAGHPNKVFATIEEAAAWLGPSVQPSATTEELLAVGRFIRTPAPSGA